MNRRPLTDSHPDARGKSPRGRRRGRGFQSPSRKPSRRRLLSFLLLAALVFIIMLEIMGRGGGREGEATIRIAPGTSTSEIARMLREEDIIGSEKDFLQEAESAGIDEKLKAGTYRFQRGEPVESILAKLEQGLQAPEGVLTVPEGYTIGEIAADVAAKTGITAEQYGKAAVPNGYSLTLTGAADAETLEGFLFPSTYNLEPGMTAEALIARQLETFKKKTAMLPWANASTVGLSRYQVLIVASMVEREAKVPEERPLVAAVIYNRLASGMKLEVDATVQYALGYWKKELTQPDLEIDSPFNTRLYGGLPPAPICNPGADAIRAALEPAAVDYLFYVATGDEEGHHFFTSSYEEFLQAKNSP